MSVRRRKTKNNVEKRRKAKQLLYMYRLNMWTSLIQQIDSLPNDAKKEDLLAKLDEKPTPL